jgi:hypothetical protein
VLVVLVTFSAVIPFVDVPVEDRESDEKCHTNKVFNTFNVLVVVNQREYLFNFTNRRK